MFSRILIANRGEIARRIIQACRELDIDPVCVYSEADRDNMYLRYAAESICIGPANSGSSYLDIRRIISAAEIADVEAIHPGYGFLSENAHFAEVCRSCRIRFIGPSPEVIATMGNKVRARELARKAGLPVIPGSASSVESEQEALAIAHEIGFPVLVKAAAGGGGRGMRVAHNDISLYNAFSAAKSEAGAAFNDATVYLEKYIGSARHIEFQIVADNYGNIIHLGERDCSIQRRHQKLIEEAPSLRLNPELRERMGADAVKLARAAGYTSVGTVEFLLDLEDNYYFIEMNTRLQVEHPVTEFVTGWDLVKEQLLLANGKRLTLKQEDIVTRGHAIECRINAEDYKNDFKPSPGTIGRYFPPGGIGVRVDTHVFGGFRVSPHYDSMIAKVIVHRANRKEAIHAMKQALDEYVIEGIETNIGLHTDLLNRVAFIRGTADTTWVEQILDF